jgi:glycerate kinase
MTARVQDPFGREILAAWAMLDNGTAVIEMATASGLVLLREDERDPRITTTYGVGQVISPALSEGARRIIVGVGGSATNDGGAGMVQALGARLLDRAGLDLRPGGAALAELDRIDVTAMDPRIRETVVIAATDVTNPLCGPEGASLVYGRQKGATPTVATELDAALRHYGEIVERDLGVSILRIPGAGAAGGLGGGLIAFLGATVRPGFDIVAEVTRLHQRIASADLAITGEGRMDQQTAYGKAVSRVAALARESDVPAIAVPGSLGEGWEAMREAFDVIEPAEVGRDMPSERLAAAVQRAVEFWYRRAKGGE